MRCAGAARWWTPDGKSGRQEVRSDSEEAPRCHGFFPEDSGEHHGPCFQDWSAAGEGEIGTQILDHRLATSMLKTLLCD